MKSIFTIIAFLIAINLVSNAIARNLTDRVINVVLTKVPDQCSLLQVSYTVMSPTAIKVPIGTTGLFNEPFTVHALTMSLNGKLFTMDLSQSIVTSKNHIVLDGYEEYSTKIDIKKVFKVSPGPYYIQYFNLWYDNWEKGAIQMEADGDYISKFASSERYFININNKGCFTLLV